MPPSQRFKASPEVRRARGEISCAECRRHKLRCDKAIPCSSCIRKGCQSLCPNGTKITSHTSLGVAHIEALNRKVSEMRGRIRHLEDALQISHSSSSVAPHPLLAEDLLAIKNSPSAPILLEESVNPLDTDAFEAFKFGSLTVADEGAESYIGIPDTVLAKYFEYIETTGLVTDAELSSSYSDPRSTLSKSFPFTALYIPLEEIQACIEDKLPSLTRASALAEAYLENLSWLWHPIGREQIFEDLIPDIYQQRQTSNPTDPGFLNSSNSSVDPHSLALLFAVFACGAVVDLTLPPWNDEADLYYHLARAALNLKPVFEGASLHAVQAVALISEYDLFACRKTDLEASWKTMSLAMILAVSIGLNRDPAKYMLSDKLIQRRRSAFWELYLVDVWKSVESGRPPTFKPSAIDCEFPEDDDAMATGGCSGGPNSSRMAWYRFLKDILAEIASKFETVRAVKYSEILSLDQKIRDFRSEEPFYLVARTHGQDTGNGTEVNLLRQFHLSMHKDITLLLLHRNFFTRALAEDPANPLRTSYAPSFLATHRSAASLLRLFREQSRCNASLLMRLWPLLGHALTATITLGSAAACGSTSALALQAYADFDPAVDMFAQMNAHPIVRSTLPILMGLRKQAIQALSQHGYASVLHHSRVILYPPWPVSKTEPSSKTLQHVNLVHGPALSVERSTSGVPDPASFSIQAHDDASRSRSLTEDSLQLVYPSGH